VTAAAPEAPERTLPPETAGAALAQAFELFETTTRRLREAYETLSSQYDRVIEERDLLAREVERTQTMAALGEMAATVAHEIRNPLGGIAGYATLLLSDLSADDPRRRHVVSIADGARRLDAVVTGLLLLAREESPVLREGDLNEVVEDLCLYAVEELRRAGRSIRCRFTPFLGEARLPLDRDRLPLVLQNLFRNAVAHQDEGGEIAVAIRRRGRRPPFLADVPCPRFEVVIDDRGPGVTPELREAIFRPFMTTRPQGTGLGLAIARKIARAHGGDLVCLSRPGGGARFVVALPARAA
jgi:signal transduction histidine kinase